MKTQYKGFVIETELGDDPKVDTTISTVRNGIEYYGSIGCAEHEGLSDSAWHNTLQVPVDVINRAYDLEDELLEEKGDRVVTYTTVDGVTYSL